MHKAVLSFWRWTNDLQVELITNHSIDSGAQSNSLDHELVIACVQEATFNGRSARFALQEIAAQLLREHGHQVHKTRVLSLLVSRISFTFIFSSVARFVVLLYFPLSRALYIYDFIMIMLAMILSLVFFEGIERLFPKSWFWDSSYQEQGKRCVRALLLGDVHENLSIFPQWLRLQERELMSGQSFHATKEIFLRFWMGSEEIESQKRRMLFEDYLPAVEFLCLGLIALLLLGLPLLQPFGW